MKKFILLCYAMLAVLLSACGQTSEGDPAADTHSSIPPALTNTTLGNVEPTIDHKLPTPEETSPIQTTILVTPTPEVYQDYPTVIKLSDPLPDDLPWLLVKMDYKLYLISEDGGHRIELDPASYFSDDYYVSFSPSPTGEMVALLVGNIALGTDENLYLWSLSENTVTLLTELYHHENFSALTFEEKENIYFSTGQVTWSHDGSKLAFTSAHLGGTTDLYLYDMPTGEILWLTTGPTQVVNPVWSPDDAYILHAGVEHLYIGYSGFGYGGWQFFSAAPDGSKVHTLAAGMEKRGEEDYLGWISDRQMLMQSDSWCGGYDLRMMNIVSGEEYFIWREYYDSLAYSPEAGLALVFIQPSSEIELEKCGETEMDPGLYLLTIPDGQFTEVPIDENDPIYFELHAFDGKLPFYLRKNGEWYTVDAEGNIEKYDGNPTLPEQFQKYDSRIDHIYGWVSSVGLEIGE